MKKFIKQVLVTNLVILFIFTYQTKSWAEAVKENNTTVYSSNIYTIDAKLSLNRDFKFADIKLNETTKVKPPLDGSKISDEILVGSLFIAIIGLLFISLPRNSYTDITTIFLILGIPLSSSLGVYLAGNDKNENNSFLFTLLGGFIGEVLAYLLAILLAYFTYSIMILVFLILFIPIFPVIGSTIFFNLSREYKPLEKVSVTENGISYKLASF